MRHRDADFGAWISNIGNPRFDHPDIEDHHPEDLVQVRLNDGTYLPQCWLGSMDWLEAGSPRCIKQFRLLKTHPHYQQRHILLEPDFEIMAELPMWGMF